MILDRWGRPIERTRLKEELAVPTLGGVRTPQTAYPGDGLNPVRLASILRQADQGDPISYLELAETIEERDPHYLGVLGTRRRSVSQIDVTVEAASDDALDVAIADMVRDWLGRGELADELFDILDAIGKGYSFTEIVWDTSEGQWIPARLEWRDPRWFRFARHDLTTPLLVGPQGEELPLEPGKFIFATIKAKSGLALRSGLARLATWGWMFKAFTQRDWAMFTQTYGQPLRVGKYDENATPEQKDILFRAVTNIAGDCAAIIPRGMEIDFIEAKGVGAAADLYEKRADWLDRQISKAVLGQTASTDAIAGGHAVGKEHREVQEDIETADAKALATILNRDLIRPWVQLEHGPQKRYPRITIARPKAVDLVQHAQALAQLVPLGLRIETSEVRDRFGYSDPKAGAEVLGAPPVSAPPASSAVPTGTPDRTSIINRQISKINRGPGSSGGEVALHQDGRPAPLPTPLTREDQIVAQLEEEAQPQVERMVGQIEAMLDSAGSLEEFRAMLMAGFGTVHSTVLTTKLALAGLAAELTGAVDIEDEAQDG